MILDTSKEENNGCRISNPSKPDDPTNWVHYGIGQELELIDFNQYPELWFKIKVKFNDIHKISDCPQINDRASFSIVFLLEHKDGGNQKNPRYLWIKPMECNIFDSAVDGCKLATEMFSPDQYGTRIYFPNSANQPVGEWVDYKIDMKRLIDRAFNKFGGTYNKEDYRIVQFTNLPWEIWGGYYTDVEMKDFSFVGKNNYCPCTSFTYSSWTTCNSSALQSRTITSQLPAGCIGESPENLIQQCSPPCLESNWQSTDSVCLSSNTLTRIWNKIGNCDQAIGINKPSSEIISCTYVSPQCTDGDWTSSISPTLCPSSGQQTKTWTKTSSCSGGVNHLSSEIISCTYNAPTCTSFTYSEWSSCSASGKQSRTILSYLPSGCQAGNPDILTRDCTYVPPTCTGFTYSEWTNCSESNSQSRTILNYIPENCQAGSPENLTRECNYVAPLCNFTYSNWSECLSTGIQNRSLINSSPENCSNSNLVLVQECNYTIIGIPNDGSNSGGGSGSNSDESIDEAYQDSTLNEPQEDQSSKNDTWTEDAVRATEYHDTGSSNTLKRLFCRFLNLFREDKKC